MALSPIGFDPIGFIVAPFDTHIYTSHNSYWVPLKCVVEIYDTRGDELLLSYDMFNPQSNPIVLLDCSVSLGLSNTQFSLTFEDGGDVIDQNIIGLGNKVMVYAGRESNDLTLLFTGYSETRTPVILGNNVMDYTMEGHGENASFNNLLVNFKRASSQLVEVEDPNFPRRADQKMAAFELVHDLIEDLDVRVTRDTTVKSYLDLDVSGISPLVTERLLAISEPLQEVSQVLNFLCDVTGAYWTIENGKLIFEYPDVQHSGIIVKNKKAATDLASSTSYFLGPWQYTDSIAKSDGFANRIYTATNIDTKSVANQMSNQGSTSLFERAIAQQITLLESRINNMAFIFSKVGDPFRVLDAEGQPIPTETADQVIDAEIRLDSGDNKPTGAVISQFKINVGSITSTADTIFSPEIKIDAALMSPNAKYWIVLMPCGTSHRDTVRWHHDGDLKTLNRYSAFARGESKSIISDWSVSRYGPTYTHAVFARIKRIQEYSDTQSIETYRIKEDQANLEFLEDSTSVAKMMQNILGYRGKPVRKYDMNEVSLPLNLWFTPGQNITVVDDTARHQEDKNIFAEVSEVSYHWSTDRADSTLGIFRVNILPTGHLNFHKEKFPSGD